MSEEPQEVRCGWGEGQQDSRRGDQPGKEKLREGWQVLKDVESRASWRGSRAAGRSSLVLGGGACRARSEGGRAEAVLAPLGSRGGGRGGEGPGAC